MLQVISSLAAALLLGAGSEGSKWLSEYGSALERIRHDDKPLFIAFCAGSSAQGGMVRQGPFVSEEVERALDGAYLRLYVDMDKPEGRAMARLFEAGETPWMVIIDRSSRWQVARRALPREAAELAGVLEQHKSSKLTALPPQVQAAQTATSGTAQGRTAYYQPNTGGFGGQFYQNGRTCPNCPR